LFYENTPVPQLRSLLHLLSRFFPLVRDYG
jgi:hypothetical protein